MQTSFFQESWSVFDLMMIEKKGILYRQKTNKTSIEKTKNMDTNIVAK